MTRSYPSIAVVALRARKADPNRRRFNCQRGAGKEPWVLRKTRYVASLEHKPLDSLLVTAADKAHNARDMVLDARRDPGSWERFNAGLDGTAWYLLRIHQTLSHRLPGSRSNELLGEAVNEILRSPAYERIIPRGITPVVWATGYLERQEQESELMPQ